MKTPFLNNQWFLDQLNLYQNANSDYESVKKNFIIRKNEYSNIIEAIANKGDKDPRQHELILGRRGSGKSTLLKRIEIEIKENDKLNNRFIAINLAEEQAGIYRLFDLWEQVLYELQSVFEIEIKPKNYAEFNSDKEYTQYLYGIIHQLTTENRKKIVLLLDNFDRIVENFTDDGHLLRETLINHNDVQIIAGSTRMDEHFWRYDMPFYEFFRRHRLEALSREEMHILLEHWSESLQIDALKNFIKANKGKLENVRLLTDGLPRTLQFFIQMVLQKQEVSSYDYLKKLMDNVTPLYQERLNSLTPPLKKTIYELAFIWEAATTKQLVGATKMESKLVSANLKTLVDKGIVDKLATTTKNHLYRLSERFFNLWIIITQGNPEQKRKAKWLSIFLENWYDAKEFEQLYRDHLSHIQQKDLPWDKVLLHTKGLSQSRYITTEQRDVLLEATEAYLPKNMENPYIHLPGKFRDIFKKILQYIDKKQYEQAISKTNEIENEQDGVKFYILGYIYNEKGETIKAIEQYKKAADKGYVKAMNNLALLYKTQEKWDLAEKYYLHAVDKGDVNAMYNLAILYKTQEKWDLAETYYLLAVDKGVVEAMNNLALLYETQEKWDLAEKYYLLAVDKGYVEAMFNLALLYETQEKWDLVEKYYLLAVDKGEVKAMNNLAFLYETQEKWDLAEKYYLLAVDKGDVEAMFNLANLYISQEKWDLAEKYYLLAVDKGHVKTMFNLALLYKTQEKWDLAEKYYLLAVDKGDVKAMNNLALLYETQEKWDLAEKYYLLAVDKGHVNAMFNLALLYKTQEKWDLAEKYYLLAVDKGYVEAMYNLALLYKTQEKWDLAEKYYLLAVDKGNVKAMNNLALLYKTQEKWDLAEKYYLLAVDKGYVEAMNNLALLYYNLNKNKAESLKLFNKSNIHKYAILIAEIWNGIFENTEQKISDYIIENQYENLNYLFNELLIHQQTQLVKRFFEDSMHGKILQERYMLWYYVVQLLTQPQDQNLKTKIPPELVSTIDELLNHLKEKEIFYGYRKS